MYIPIFLALLTHLYRTLAVEPSALRVWRDTGKLAVGEQGQSRFGEGGRFTQHGKRTTMMWDTFKYFPKNISGIRPAREYLVPGGTVVYAFTVP